MNVFFDVQGTLLGGGAARPHVREVFEELSGRGHHLYIWSSGGESYARRAAEALGVSDLVRGCFSKSAPLPVRVDFAVDDHPAMVEPYGGYAVRPFRGDPDDAALLAVLQAVRRAAGERRSPGL